MNIDDMLPTATVDLSMLLLHEGAQASGAEYVCPMHPDVTSNEPGRCPRCGMKLVPAKATQEKSVP